MADQARTIRIGAWSVINKLGRIQRAAGTWAASPTPELAKGHHGEGAGNPAAPASRSRWTGPSTTASSVHQTSRRWWPSTRCPSLLRITRSVLDALEREAGVVRLRFSA